MSTKRWLVAVSGAGLLLAACSGTDDGNRKAPSAEGAPSQATTVLDRLGKSKGHSGIVDYVARFRTVDDARRHRRALAARGIDVGDLDAEGRIVRVAAAAEALAGVEAQGGTVAPNVPVRVAPPPRNDDGPIDDKALEGLLTARSITGVDGLAARVPEGDGRLAKVAIFDTGIDFDLPGVSAGGKLTGYFDVTGFGAIAPGPVVAKPAPATTNQANNEPMTAFATGAKTLRLPVRIGAKSVTTGGIFDEAAQARRSLSPGYDINRNGQLDDTFPFIVGTNADGKLALWIDLDGNGTIDDRSTEELTDFNSTGRTVDARGKRANGPSVPLAVTLRSDRDVQFHSLATSSGHGSNCATIVAGDGFAGGRLRGMAPKAKLASYLLDPYGQDVYTMAELVRMFTHAKGQGVDAISISYGFARGDLHAARFLADFLDDEIASAGIVIGLAAGNEGPGLRSAAADDYVPHHGFAVGAHVSPLLARNVYGWTGSFEENVVYYSSVGPTEGGRAVPDIVSPFMNLARGRSGSRVSPFSGTSSATPAFIGSVAALISALKATEGTAPQARLLKLAIMQAAHKVPGVPSLFQGAGLVDVGAAYDVYRRLASEEVTAKTDLQKEAPVALDLRASVQSAETTEPQEGVVVRGAPSSVKVTLAVTDATSILRDFGAQPEPLVLEHQESFFTAPDALLLARPQANVVLSFDPDQLREPGVYTDVLTVRRPADGLALLRVPVLVVVESKIEVSTTVSIDANLRPDEAYRMPIELSRPSALRFSGVVVSGAAPGSTFDVGGTIVTPQGASVPFFSASAATPVAVVDETSAVLPAGHYEVVVVAYPGPTASFRRDLRVTGVMRLAPLHLVASRSFGGKVSVALGADEAVSFDTARLTLEGARSETHLQRTKQEGRDGFAGSIALPFPIEDFAFLSILLRQDVFDDAVERSLASEVTFFGPSQGPVLERTWVPFAPVDGTVSGPFTTGLPLGGPLEGEIGVFAYPNIVDWSTFSTQSLSLTVGVPLPEPIVSSWPVSPQSLVAGQVARIDGSLPAGTPAGAYGVLELLSRSKVVGRLPIELP